ncbi:MAG: DUF1905 domain-containing protein [Chloroflexi bacterium]|nr:MAG: DUF1905 domain-containing protein [Chloroflexota bacterium]
MDENTCPRQQFQAVLETDLDSSATFIVIPFDVQQIYGTRGRVPVAGTINGYPFRTTLSPYGGKHYLGINKATRDSANVRAGELVEIVLDYDSAPRTVTLPDDFAQALQASEKVQSAWNKLSYTKQKEIVRSIEGARKPETRQSRIERTISRLEI